MTTVVTTSEEDPALTVVRFTSELSWADAGPQIAEPEVAKLCAEAEECMVMGRWLDLVSLMIASVELISSKLSEKDFECILTVICNLVTKSENLDETLEMAKLISTKVCQQMNDKPASRLKILFSLYNLLDDPSGRFYVYMKALALASNAKVADHIIPSFKKIDSFLKEWNVEISDKRELFLAIGNILRDNKSSPGDYFKFLDKYLATFSGEDVTALSEAKGEAVKAIVEFIKAPDMFECDLLDLPAIKQLEADAENTAVYQLLKIFLTQRLDAYMEFQAANSALLKFHGINHLDCVTKMRMMSLIDIGSNVSSQIPYATIIDALQIDADEVEFWVVKAMTAKLLNCKLDQMNEVVIVSRSLDRVFGQPHWEHLRTKLAAWRGNVSNGMSTIQLSIVPENEAQVAPSPAIRSN
ncbi:unnamed protein product [Rhodiola kirilowii]